MLNGLSIDKIRNYAEDSFNQIRPKSDLERNVYEVLSHKNWGSSSTLLNDIAQDTFDFDKFPTITRIMWDQMDNRPAAWRVVFKSLTLCEHLIKKGSERCVDDARYHSHQLRSLENFNYYEGNVDRGVGVREKAKQIIELLGDDERIREERSKAKQLRERFGGVEGGANHSGGGYSNSQYSGYGNDGLGSKGTSSSYGGSGGGFGDSQGFSGRYSDKDSKPSSSAPTFASLPPKKSTEKPASKVKKSKKKKKKESKNSEEKIVSETKAPEVDLFSFDATAETSTTKNEDEFDAFTNARVAPAPADDDFGDFTGTSTAPAVSTDLFGNVNSQVQTQKPESLDPFASNNTNVVTQNMQQMSLNTMSSNTNAAMMFNTSSTNTSTGMMPNTMLSNMNATPMSNSMPSNANTAFMSSTMPSNMNTITMPISNTATQHQPESDDFGDFSGPASSKPPNVSSDPLSKLVNLDGLTKTSKKDDPIHTPIIFNAAAAQANVNQGQPQVSSSTVINEMAFHGIDGIQKPIDLSIMSSATHRSSGQPIMTAPASTSMTPNNPMGSQMGGNRMMNLPNRMMAGTPQTAQMMAMNPQTAQMMQTPNMMGGMAQTPNMMGGMAQTPNMMGGMGQTPNMMGGMGQTPNMMGGMGQTPNMMGGMGQTPNMMGGMGQTPNMMGGATQSSNMTAGHGMNMNSGQIPNNQFGMMSGQQMGNSGGMPGGLSSMNQNNFQPMAGSSIGNNGAMGGWQGSS